MLTDYKRINDEKEFRWWFDRATIGETVVYHVGDLAYDRTIGLDQKKVDDIGATAYEYARTHELHLLQARVCDNVFEYRAVKTIPKSTERLEKWLRKPLPPKAIESAQRPNPVMMGA